MKENRSWPRPFPLRHTLAALISLSAFLLQAADTAPATNDDTIGKSVVKIFTTVRYPDYFKPWSKQSPTSLVGSGVVMEGKRILTTAHIVLYSSQVQIQANEAGDKVTATVAGLSPEMDLALLKLDDDSFFDNHPPLARARDLPEIKDAVMVYGFPTGGSSMSITKGIVSRIEFTKYNYAASGLRIQVDAAINPGNSGGPAVVGDKMIGLAFAHLSQAENISYIIPCEEIELFLNNMVDGAYHGRPFLGARLQALQNPALRSFLNLDKSVHGAVVQVVMPLPRQNPLRKWDVITAIGGTPIDDEGMVKVGRNLRVSYSYLLNQTVSNGMAPLTVIRSGQPIPLLVQVTRNPGWVMSPLKGSYPSYFVYGPLVFSDATEDLFITMVVGQAARLWTPILLEQGSPLLRRFNDYSAYEGEQLVVATTFFPHKLSRGYSNPTAEVVKTVNGVAVKNLAHLVELLRDGKDPFVTIDFDGRNTDTLVFRRSEMVADSDEILTENNVRTQGSPDMMAIWNAGKK
jgi:S1-C subfamily serine protease